MRTELGSRRCLDSASVKFSHRIDEPYASPEDLIICEAAQSVYIHKTQPREENCQRYIYSVILLLQYITYKYIAIKNVEEL